MKRLTKCTVVIETRSGWLKLIAAKPSLKGSQILILRVAVRPIDPSSEEAQTKALSDLIKELGLKPKPLIISFPRDMIIARNLRFPSTDPKEIRDMVNLHVVRQVPYAKEEIVSDYQILEIDEAGYTKVMLAIVHRDVLRSLYKILDGANLSAEKVELSSYGAWNWILFSQEYLAKSDDLHLLLDMDRDFTDFIIFSKDSLLFSRNIALGAGRVQDKAERTRLVGEIKQSLVIFQSEEMNKRPSKVFLTGAAPNIQSLGDLLKTELNLPVESIGPFQDIPFSKDSAGIPTDLPQDLSLSSVTGLAIDTQRKKISFTLPEIQVGKEIKKRARQLTLLGSLVIYIFIIIYGIFLGRMYNRESYLGHLNSRLEKIEQETGRLAGMARNVEIVKGRLDPEGSALNCLHEIHRLIPPEITIRAITFEEASKVNLRGEAQAMSDVFRFITTLEESAIFEKIETKYTRKKKVEDKELSEFEIVCRLVR